MGFVMPVFMTEPFFQGAGVPPPTFRKRTVVQMLNVMPTAAAARAIQNQT
jgi:hypothetical protein